MAVTGPPGWPDGVRPPEVEGWQDEAVEWLLDWGDPTYRLDPFLRAQPAVLARMVAARLHGDLRVARDAWTPLPEWEQVGLPAEAHPAAVEMLRRVGPALAARARAADLIYEALQGTRWVPRL